MLKIPLFFVPLSFFCHFLSCSINQLFLLLYQPRLLSWPCVVSWTLHNDQRSNWSELRSGRNHLLAQFFKFNVWIIFLYSHYLKVLLSVVEKGGGLEISPLHKYLDYYCITPFTYSRFKLKNSNMMGTASILTLKQRKQISKQRPKLNKGYQT